MIKGISVVAVFSMFSVYLSTLSLFKQYAVSPLVISIVFAMIVGNILKDKMPASWQSGIVFCSKIILRIGIMLYGFRVTFHHIYEVGFAAILVSAFMVSSTFFIGYLLGKYVFKLDRDLSILISLGNAICGAAAILAAECMLKADKHKTSIAIGGVVIFGTLSMFLYPFLFSSGLLTLNESNMGIYVGGSIHEVAHVVAAGNAISQTTASTAVVTKMLRVMMLAPFLLVLGLWLKHLAVKCIGNKDCDIHHDNKISVPWFVFGFILVVGLNSVISFPAHVIFTLHNIDTFLLTMAMAALGFETRTEKFKGIGFKPLYLNGVLFLWLLFGGYIITSIAIS